MSRRTQISGLSLSRLFLTGGVVLLVVSHLFVLPLPHNRDVGVWSYAGWRLLAGDVPYRDFFDHKPPGIFLVYAFGELLGGGAALVRLLNLAGALVATWALRRMVLELSPSRSAGIANVAGGLFASIVGSPQIEQGAGQTESLSLGLLVPAYAIVAWVLASPRAIGLRWPFFAGLLAALALSLRVSAVPDVALLLGALFFARAPASRPRPAQAYLFGAFIPPAAYALYATATASGPFAIDALASFNSAYTSTTGLIDDPLANGLAVSAYLLPLFAGALMAAAIGLITGLVTDRRPLLGLVALWVVAAIVEVVVPQRFFRHYYLILAAPLAAAAAWLRPLALARLPTAATAVGAAVTLYSSALATLQLVPNVDLRISGRLVTVQEEVAATVERKTAASATALVWGVEPDVLYLARRRSVTRYIYTNVVLFPGGGDRYAEILERARSAPPDALVLAEDWVTGKEPVLPRALCQLFAGFAREPADSLGYWLVYTRRGAISFADDASSGKVQCVADSELTR